MRDWTFPFSDTPALVDADQGLVVTYADLSDALDGTARGLERWQPGAPHFLLARNSMDHALAILSAFREKIPLALIDPELAPERLAELVAIYRLSKPDWRPGLSGKLRLPGLHVSQSGRGRIGPIYSRRG